MRAPKLLVGPALLLAASLAAASPPDRGAVTNEALGLCRRSSFVAQDTALALVERGIVLARTATAETPNDKVAHFALFCNLARRMSLAGIGIGTMRDLLRARRALERSLQIDPTYVDALAARGALLYYSPRLTGGDAAAGERVIREVLATHPENPVRLVLVELLVDRSDVGEARREARRSLEALDASADPTVRAGARALLDHLCAREWPEPVAEVLRTSC
jgi:hypothetical protein